MLADLRDISIILLAFGSIIVGIILLLLLWQVRLLVLLLRDEIGPILKNTQETTQTLQATTTFVGKRVARPFVKTMSFAAGVKGALRSLSEDIEKPPGSASNAAKATIVETGVVETASTVVSTHSISSSTSTPLVPSDE